ncbi:MAG: xanthine dehydrogenase family protein subunit M, partial [Verrucomicrobia bacterium]|nr:xanthine dehydrogenase family protein subunit M [Verrucomicrobiota bacterium]
MRAFQYIAVESIAEACDVLAEHGDKACVLAGGTDLLIEWRRGATKAPRVVVDISRVGELDGIAESESGITIMPLVTHRRLLCSEVLRKSAPLLCAAAGTIGSPQIRARGTVGGNIMNGAACADTVPPLIALGARVTLQSKDGVRELELADLFVKPYHTKAKQDELLTAIHFPRPRPGHRSAFIKLGRRNALSISRLSVAAMLEIGVDGKIAEARIVPGAAFPMWRRVPEAEQMLVGEKAGADLFAAAGRKVAEVMIQVTGRRWSTEYKEPVLGVLVRRALEECAFCREGRGLEGEGRGVGARAPRPAGRAPLAARPA